MKVLIVEDEVLIAEDIKDKLLKLGFINVEMAHSKNEAELKLKLTNPDVVLLDIHLENGNDGLELANWINKFSKTPFIFVTSYTNVEMIKKIVQTKPYAYLSKPIKVADLTAQMELLRAYLIDSQKQFIILKDGLYWVKVFLADINYAVADGNYINIYHAGKRTNVRLALSDLIKQLPNPPFIKLSRSVLINMDKVTGYSKKSVFINDVEFNVPRNHTQHIFGLIENHLTLK